MDCGPHLPLGGFLRPSHPASDVCAYLLPYPYAGGLLYQAESIGFRWEFLGGVFERFYVHGLWFDAGELNDIIRMGTLDKDNRILLLLEDMFGMKAQD